MFFEQKMYYGLASDVPIRSVGKAGEAIDWSKEWPEKTSILCWQCAHPFETKPVPLATKYDPRLNVFHVMGAFCSWNCVKQFCKTCRPCGNSGVDDMVLSLFYKRCTKRIDSIVSAPPRFLLEAFGGHMTIDEYRRQGRDRVSYDILPPKMILRTQIVHAHRLEEERNRLKPQNLAEVVDMSSNGSLPKVSELKLRRPAAAKKQSTLEKTIGIISSGSGT